MSFNFSQNLLSDLSNSQSSSQSDSLPPTQPMIINNRSRTYNQEHNFMPRPPSCPDLLTSTSLSRDQQSVMNPMSQTLRDIQTSLSKIPSVSSRMLEEALGFLNKLTTEEEERTKEQLKLLKDVVEEIAKDLRSYQASATEVNKVLESSTNILKSLSDSLKKKDVELNFLLEVVDGLEGNIDNQSQSNGKFIKDIRILNEDLDIKVANICGVVKEIVDKELNNIRQSRQIPDPDRSFSTLGRSGGLEGEVSTVNRTSVKHLSIAPEQQRRNVNLQSDFSMVITMDEESEEEMEDSSMETWEE